MMKHKLTISLVALGLVGILGIGLGFGINAALDSDDSLSIPAATTQAKVAAPLPEPAQSNVTAPQREPAQARVAAPHPAPASEAQGVSTDVTIVPDTDFELALRDAGISARGWKTDFSRHTVPYSEILSGGPPRDGIPPVDDPKFITPEDASAWLGDQEPVIAFELNGDSRAYPLQILTLHEIVNDVVGGVPVAATFCPLCNAAIVFDRRLDGVVYDFGTSGNLRRSDLIMWDRQTESWWQQFTGEGIVGELAGKKLTILPASIISFSDFRAANPQGIVLSRDTGFKRNYGRNPYAGYDRADNPPFLFRGDLDGRLLPKERVATFTIGDVDAAFPFSALAQIHRRDDYAAAERAIGAREGDGPGTIWGRGGPVFVFSCRGETL